MSSGTVQNSTQPRKIPMRGGPSICSNEYCGVRTDNNGIHITSSRHPEFYVTFNMGDPKEYLLAQGKCCDGLEAQATPAFVRKCWCEAYGVAEPMVDIRDGDCFHVVRRSEDGDYRIDCCVHFATWLEISHEDLLD
jgi:hypothetical protein